ncbi:MAG: PD-(D/E)XK nuclease family protein, partial [Candidatus Staskawiczbacteria bacterium]|nr:PD-(D/E)XK nuclease family protein [Candidatus Staskawiczbacteria bacterium]
YNDFAILVRANSHAAPFVRALERAGLPYQFLASRGLYSKPVILDVISYFRLLDNCHESSSLFRILNLDFLGIQEQETASLTLYSHKKTKSLFETLQDLPLLPKISAKTKEKINFLLALIEKHTRLAKERGVSEVFAAFLEDSGYLKSLVAKEDSEKIDLLNQFYKKIKRFEETAKDPGLKNFMEEISLELESGEEGKLEFDPEKGPDMIKVMTIHAAKGLEFKYVFLANMVDKRFPAIERKDPIELPDELIKDIKPKGDAHLQEERRICYVAMTRAKKGLYFTSAEDYGGQRKKKLSRFLIEMGYSDKSQIPNPKSQNEFFRRKAVLVKRNKNKLPNEYLPEHFSYSQLAAFQKCPLQYKFNFIMKIPIKGKAVFSFGKTMHGALFEFLKNANEFAKIKQEGLFGPGDNKNNGGNFDYLAGLYEKNWIDEWYESKQQKEEYRKLGRKIIKDFYEEFSKNPPKIFKIGGAAALEIPFNLKLKSYTIFGVIDRIDEKEGGAAIVDYKTGKPKDRLDFDDKEQLLIYQIACQEIFKIKLKELTYYYLESGKKMSFLGRDGELEEQKRKIIEIIEQIKNSEFSATPGWQCKFCDFKDICDFADRS